MFNYIENFLKNYEIYIKIQPGNKLPGCIYDPTTMSKISQKKYSELQSELEYLKTTRSKELNESWRLAVEEGDDRETDGLTVALKLLEENQIRMIELQEILSKSTIIDRVERYHASLGASVEIRINGKNKSIQLTDPIEADPLSNNISVESPLGQSILGKKVGDSFDFKAPNGNSIRVEILVIN
jgi:transcription elongation factor GreA